MPVKSLITFQNQATSQLGIDPAFEEAASVHPRSPAFETQESALPEDHAVVRNVRNLTFASYAQPDDIVAIWGKAREALT